MFIGKPNALFLVVPISILGGLIGTSIGLENDVYNLTLDARQLRTPEGLISGSLDAVVVDELGFARMNHLLALRACILTR